MARSSFLRLSLAAFLALASTGCVNLHGVDAGRGEPVDAGVDSGMDWEPCVIDRPSHLSLYTPDLVSNIELYDELFWNRSNRHAALSLTLSELAPRAPDGTCLSVTPELLARIDDAMSRAMTLVRVRDGSTVPSRVESGFVDLHGAEQAEPRGGGYYYSLVADSWDELEDGWYVLRVDTDALNEIEEMVVDIDGLQPHLGEVAFARIHKGSRPMWRLAQASCSTSSEACTVAIISTETLSAPMGGRVSVRYDGTEVRCEGTRTATFGMSVECPYTEHGDFIGTVIDVDYVGDSMLTPTGEALVEGDGVSATITPGAGPDRNGYPDPDFALGIVRGS